MWVWCTEKDHSVHCHSKVNVMTAMNWGLWFRQFAGKGCATKKAFAAALHFWFFWGKPKERKIFT